jgi:hypothetical protein
LQNLVQWKAKLVLVVPDLPEQNYSQIDTFYDGILRKRDDMIISLITVLIVRDDTRKAHSRDMRYHDNSRLSLLRIP